MRTEGYVDFICNNATELSIPNEWSHLRRQLTQQPRPLIDGRRVIDRCAVVGGGVMGRGIVIALLRAGFRTTLIERDAQVLAQRMADIWQTLADDLQKGRVTRPCIIHAGELLRGSTDFEVLRNVDLVIEAVFENMALKLDVFRTLDRVCPGHAILCTNTSTLDIEALARATNRPANVVGMHFFVPSHLNPALEIIYCDKTSADSISTVIKVGQKLDKISVLMRNGPGFVGNRMFRCYLYEAIRLVELGFSPEEVDVAFRNFGFVLGPCQTVDMIGLDTLLRVSQENKWSLSEILALLVENGRLGRKTGTHIKLINLRSALKDKTTIFGRGFYLYKNNHRHHDDGLRTLINKACTQSGRPSLTQEGIIRKCLYPLVNEGFNVLCDKIVDRAESIDAIWVIAYGWPRSKGGPMHWAQTEGLQNVLDYLTNQGATYQWQPSRFLQKLVQNGSNLPLEQWSQLSKL